MARGGLWWKLAVAAWASVGASAVAQSGYTGGAGGAGGGSAGAAEPDYFHDMDGGAPLSEAEVRGRNTWLLWCAGNEGFWDHLAKHSYGLTDLLKIVAAPSAQEGLRSTRFATFGLNNDPDTRAATGPDKFGLWIDTAKDPAAPKPDVKMYGMSSGVVGLRLFENPKFDASKWDAERYFNDETYYTNPRLERPYLVGMSCAFCHVAPHPLYPPANVEEPEWKNLSSAIGAQYFHAANIFAPRLNFKDRTESHKSSFMYQLLNAAKPGTIDTSLIATDGIVNPNTMNGIWRVPQRVAGATKNRLGAETIAAWPTDVLETTGRDRRVPSILFDGADSIGVYGALSRVFVNIGSDWEEWIKHHNPLLGIRAQSPYPAKSAMERSEYSKSTEARVKDLTAFFIHSTGSMRLADAPGGKGHLPRGENAWDEGHKRGREVFARNCIQCHSSVQPSLVPSDPAGYAAWVSQPTLPAEYMAWALHAVEDRSFWEENYLSIDRRIPVTTIGTNSARSLATNAIKGNIWEVYSSDSYKEMPAVKGISYTDPFTQKAGTFDGPAGGPGYVRPATLAGVWATAPFLHNNSVGLYNGDPSVAGRLAAFDDAITKMLWPAKRDRTIAVLDRESYLRIPANQVPFGIGSLIGHPDLLIFSHPKTVATIAVALGVLVIAAGIKLGRAGRRGAGVVAWVVGLGAFAGGGTVLLLKDRMFEVGPIPKGMPIALLGGLDTERTGELAKAIFEFKRVAAENKLKGITGEEAVKRLRETVAPKLFELSRCKDFYEDHGHERGVDLSDEDKRALIELLKTF